MAIREDKAVEAYETDDEIIVCGMPPEETEGTPTEERHNCDAMGCTSVSHVLYRFLKKEPMMSLYEKELGKLYAIAARCCGYMVVNQICPVCDATPAGAESDEIEHLSFCPMARFSLS